MCWAASHGMRLCRYEQHGPRLTVSPQLGPRTEKRDTFTRLLGRPLKAALERVHT